MERPEPQHKKSRDQAEVESMRRFLDSRLVLAKLQSAKAPSLAPPRSIAFSRRIINRYRQMPTTNLSAFLQSLFGDRLATSDMPRFQGSMIYRKPGQALHQSFHTRIVKSVLSLTVNRLEQCFGVWLNQVYAVQMPPSLKNRIPFVAPSRREFLSQPARELVPHEVLYKIERSLQTIYANDTGRQSPQDLSFQMMKPLLNVYAARQADEIKHESRMIVLKPQSQYFIHPQQYSASGHSDSMPPRDRLWPEATRDFYRTTFLAPMALAFSARGMAEKIEAVYATKHLAGSAAASRTAYAVVSGEPTAEVPSRQPAMSPDVARHHLKPPRRRMGERRQDTSSWPVALINIKNWIEQKKEVALSFTISKTSSMRRADRVLLKAERSTGLKDVNEDAFAPLMNRKIIAGTMRAHDPITGDRVSHEFSFLRREEQMRPPLQSYTFAQPVRSIIVEEQVVKRAQEKKVVEIVRKEVEVAMKSRSFIADLSRADYSRIADYVYSSLARRVLMDKERRGFSF